MYFVTFDNLTNSEQKVKLKSFGAKSLFVLD